MRVLKKKRYANRRIVRKIAAYHSSGGKNDEDHAIFKKQSHHFIARQQHNHFTHPNLSQLKPVLGQF